MALDAQAAAPVYSVYIDALPSQIAEMSTQVSTQQEPPRLAGGRPRRAAEGRLREDGVKPEASSPVTVRVAILPL